MNVVIIEDEPLTARNLERMILQVAPEAKVLAKLESVAESAEWLNTNDRPDLIFMDIQLSDGVSFDIFEKVNISSPVIFTTAYDEFAIRAFKVNSVDYLLKPVDLEQLQQAIEKFKMYHSSGGEKRLQAFAAAYKSDELPKYKERYFAHFKGGIVPVPASRCACFIKETLIYILTADNEKLVTDYHTIDEIEDVADPAKFFRANRQMLINIDEVASYKKHDTGKMEVHLKCNQQLRVDVSREKANEFLNWLDR